MIEFIKIGMINHNKSCEYANTMIVIANRDIQKSRTY